MTQEEKNELIKEVLADFDFEKVDKVMRMFNWGWMVYGSETPVVPGVYGLMTEATRLLRMVLDEEEGETHSVLCGGLEANWDGEELRLNFILESGLSCVEGK